MSDSMRSTPDVPYIPAGPGCSIRWLCMGCGKPRDSLGAQGTGIRKRCAACVAAREEKRAAKGVA